MTGVRRVLPVASAFLLLGLALLLTPPTLHLVPSVQAAKRTVTLIGSVSAWNSSQVSGPNPSITVVQGDNVTMVLSSTDVMHRFLVDADGDGPSDTSDCLTTDPCSAFFTSSSSTIYAFKVSFAPGTYEYYCTIHTMSMRGKFIVQGFTTTSNPTSITIPRGSTATTSVTLTSVNGFAGTVDLSYSAPAGITASFSPTTVPLPSGSTGTSQATISVANGVAAGSYVAALNGTSGSATQSATVTITVTDFSLTANPTSVTVSTGKVGNSTIMVGSINGFSSTVTLSFGTNSSNLSCNLSPTSIPGGSGGSTLSCNSATPANYQATVTGMNSTLSHSVSVDYHVTNAPDFSITANPTSALTNASATLSSTITLSPFNGFTGNVTLAVTTNSPNLVCMLSSTSITGGSGTSTLSCQGSTAGNYLANVTGTSGTLSHSATFTDHVQDFTITASTTSITVNAGTAGTTAITVVPLNGFAGTVSLADSTNSTGLACTLSSTNIAGGSGTSALSCSSSITANYLATITGSSSTLSHSANAVYHVQDFSLTVNPLSLSLTQGSTGRTTITVTSRNGFAGTISLAGTISPTGPSISLSSVSISVSSGGSGLATETVSAASSVPTGNYSINVTATSGSLSHSTTLQVTVGSASSPPSGLANLPPTILVSLVVAAVAAIVVTVFLVRRRARKPSGEPS